MRFLWINHIQNAHQSLRSNRVRSILTMLGVTIGVASITTILALSSGASKVVTDQIDSLGNNIAIIRPGAINNSMTKAATTQFGQGYAASTLTESDLVYIRNIPHIKSVAPLMSLTGTIRGDSVAKSVPSILATTPELANISKLRMNQGQFLDETIDQNTAVVGAQLSVDIFGTGLSLGRTFTIHNQTFTVIGVLKRLNDPINYNSIDFDNAAIVNFGAGKKLNQNIAQIQQIDIQADSISNLGQVIIAINKTLLTSHHGENDFSVLTGNQISQPTGQLFYEIAGVTTAVAAISLLVGGIGIMNIMLVTVAERTREIGVRKALGASNSDISWQFLIESLAISVGGGTVGYVVGYALALGISSFLTFEPVISWQIAIVALSISIAMGTLFGLYPAIRAARKDPIESLRQYD